LDVVAVDGGYIVLGYYGWFSPESSDVWLIGLNDLGDTAWTRTYGGAGQEPAFGLRRVSDGGLVITGWTSSFGAGGADVYLIKTDSSCNVAVAEPKASPTRAPAFSLSCEPNPFSGATRISLKPPASSSKLLTLRIYDAQGRAVRSFSSLLSPLSSLKWDGTDDFRHPLPSGAYFVRIDSGNEHATARIVLQR
jgi:hypothetical protein